MVTKKSPSELGKEKDEEAHSVTQWRAGWGGMPANQRKERIKN